MKKQIRALALAVLFALSLLPAAGFAAENVATVNGTGYTSLQDALNAAAAGSGDVTVEILADIDLTGEDWNPVTVSAPHYPKVTVNGNNKTISGLNDMLFAGTWAGGSGLIINDLTIADSNIVNDPDDIPEATAVGAFIGYPQASAVVTLSNCHLVNSTVNGGHWTGGLIGTSAGYSGNDGPVFMTLTITGCSVKDSTITGKGSVGGVIGHGAQSDWTQLIIEDTTVSGNTITSTGTSNVKAGTVMGTIGAAGCEKTVHGVSKTGGVSVDVNEGGNNVTSNGTKITTVYGRKGSDGGRLAITGGIYENAPVNEEDSAFASAPQGSYTVGPLPSEAAPAYAGPVMNWVKVNAANNGVVKSGPLAASAGATVTLYPKAAEGYVLDTVEVLDAEGNAVELDGLKFAIPAGGVTVNATFKLAQ